MKRLVLEYPKKKKRESFRLLKPLLYFFFKKYVHSTSKFSSFLDKGNIDSML